MSITVSAAVRNFSTYGATISSWSARKIETTIWLEVSLGVAGSRIASQPAALASAVGWATRAAAAFSLPAIVLSRASSASISASPNATGRGTAP